MKWYQRARWHHSCSNISRDAIGSFPMPDQKATPPCVPQGRRARGTRPEAGAGEATGADAPLVERGRDRELRSRRRGHDSSLGSAEAASSAGGSLNPGGAGREPHGGGDGGVCL